MTGDAEHNRVSLRWNNPGDSSITSHQILRRDRAVHGEGKFIVLDDDTGSAGQSYVDNSVQPENKYVYRIKARNAAGLSSRSGYFNADTPAAPPPPEPESQDPPAQPTGLTSAVTHDSVALSWDDPQDDSITGYRILRLNRAEDDLGEFHVHVSDTGSAATSYLDSDVEPETRYVYRIRALNAQGESPRSGYTDADTPAAPASPEQQVPSAPTGLDAAASHDSVTLSWTDPEDASITGYQILRGPDADNLATIVEDTGNAEVSYTDETVEPDTTYVYAIRALNAQGESPQSGHTNADTPAPPVPAAPANLFTAASHNQVLLNWDDPDDDSITGYRILRGPDADSLTTLVEDTTSATTSYTDDSVEPETTYVYALQARNSSGESDRSETAEVTTTAAPADEEPLVTAKQVAEISLVSNTGESLTRTFRVGMLTNSEYKYATSFHTGENPDGYALSSVQLNINRENSSAIPEVSIFSDSSGSVGTSLHTLTNPSNLPLHTDSTTYELVTFTAPSGTTLVADTTYWLVAKAVNPGTEVFYRTGLTSSDNEVSDDSPEWGIGDAAHVSTDGGAWVHAENKSFHMNVQGRLINPPGVVTITPEEAQISTELTASLTDEDGGVTNVRWQWASSHDGETGWTNISNARTASYTPVNFDRGQYLRATASYNDNHGTGKTASGIIEGPPALALVSNTAETATTALTVAANVANNKFDHATSFHTGNNPDGYALTSVQVLINRTGSSSIPEVFIFSDSSGSPGTSLHTLTNPSALPLHTDQSTYTLTTFAASDDTTLSADTTYWVVLKVTDTGSLVAYRIRTTESDDETSDDSPEWEIGDVTHRSENDAAWSEHSMRSIQMNIQGKLINPPGVVTITPEDAQVGTELTAYLTDEDGGLTNVRWQWASSHDGETGWTNISGATTDTYSLTYANRGEYLRATASYNDNHGSGKTASGIIEGPPALALVSNTAETRAGSVTAAVNLGELDFNYATSFHTGDHAEGYAFTSVELYINRTSSEVIPIISIFSDNSGTPGTSLHTLTNPSTLPIHDDTMTFELTTFTAPGNITLAADTTYWVSVTAADDGSIRTYRAGTTKSDNEISSDSPEWGIGDTTYQTTDGTTWTQSSERSILMNMQGRLINPRGVVTFDQPRPNIDNLLTASLADEDGGITNVRWQWSISDDGETAWTDISGASSASYTPVEADVGRYLRATVSYDDHHGSGQRAEAVTGLPVFALRITLTLNPGMFAYEFHSTDYEPLGDFRFQWKSPSVTPWPTDHQFTYNCALPGITRPDAMECGWESVSPGNGVARQLADLVINHPNREYDFRIVGELREGGELFSNNIRMLVVPDPTLSSSTERGIKAWRVDTAGRFIVEWHLAQSCPANKRFYIRSDTSSKFAWPTPGRDQHGRLLFSDPPTLEDDNSAAEVYIYCATGQGDSNRGHIYATADIAAKGADPVLGAEQTR